LKIILQSSVIPHLHDEAGSTTQLVQKARQLNKRLSSTHQSTYQALIKLAQVYKF